MKTKELAIVTYIKKFGLAKAIKEFKLKCKVHEFKILLKYDQIESNMGFQEVQDCRGLILEKDTWRVMSLAFQKFFNAAEGHASKIDWKTANVFDKCDGSMIQVYWDFHKNKWFAGTSGMAEGEGEVNEKPNTSFNELFWETVRDKYDFNEGNLVKGRTYTFELMTPYNIVVCPHGESKVALLGVRNLNTLNELNYEELRLTAIYLNVPVVKRFDFNATNVGHLIAKFDGMPYTEEGYVVCDAKFNRIKIKNPAYLAAHHLKSKTSAYYIMVIVKTNEIAEYGATFPDRLEEMNGLKANYDNLLLELEAGWEWLQEFKPKNITPQEKKKYAMKVFELIGEVKPSLAQFKGLYFELVGSRETTIKDWLFEYDEKKLYEMFTK
jgi:hypothetical protein